MDEIELLAQHVRKSDFAALPEEARRLTKIAIIDLLGVAVAGASAPGCSTIVEELQEWGGSPTSTVIAHDLKLPAVHAAFANSTFGHALDFDDTHDPAQLHATAAIVPAALAVAERLGGVSGRSFMTAIAVGVDVGARLSMALRGNMHDGWVPASIFAGFGAVGAVAKVMELDAEQIGNAFGLFYGQAAGARQALLDGALAKRMQPAFASMQAVYATSFAKRGISGARNVVSGKYGLAALYAGGKLKGEALTEGLGTRFEIANMSFKLYPCCRGTHAAIEGTLGIAKREHLGPDAVESVDVSVAPFTYDLVGSPFQIRGNPQVDAQFSIPYTVAVALRRGAVGLSDFRADTVVNDAQVHRLAAKVTVRPDLNALKRDGDPTRTIVRIKCRDGRQFAEGVGTLKGEPQSALTIDECVEKYGHCAAFAQPDFPASQSQRLIASLLSLEELGDVRQLCGHLGRRPA